jgi:hypothetical protein
VAYPFSANFANSIIYGNQLNELAIDDSATEFIYTFDHCLLKTDLNISSSGNFVECLKNEDPLFVDYLENNYQLDSLSPAKNIGDPVISTTIPTDINGKDRTQTPDLGAYEWIPVLERK